MSAENFTKNGKFLVAALDHLRCKDKFQNNNFYYIQNRTIQKTISNLEDNGITGIISTIDVFNNHYVDCGRIIRLDNGYKDNFNLITSVQEADDYNADAVIISYYPDSNNTKNCLDIIGEVSKTCKENNMCYIVEILPPNKVDTKTLCNYLSIIKKKASFDFLKIPYTDDDFKKVVSLADCSVGILSGSKEEHKYFLKNLEKAIENGANGFFAGRILHNSEKQIKKLMNQFKKIVYS